VAAAASAVGKVGASSVEGGCSQSLVPLRRRLGEWITRVRLAQEPSRGAFFPHPRGLFIAFPPSSSLPSHTLSGLTASSSFPSAPP